MVKYMLYKALRKVPCSSHLVWLDGVGEAAGEADSDPGPPYAHAATRASLARQYVDSLFCNRTAAEKARLQDLLYLGSDEWQQLHRDYAAKGQPFIKTAEVGGLGTTRKANILFKKTKLTIKNIYYWYIIYIAVKYSMHIAGLASWR